MASIADEIHPHDYEVPPTAKTLTKQAHNPRDLVQGTTASFSCPAGVSFITKALNQSDNRREYRRWLRGYDKMVEQERPATETERALKNGFRILSKIFFMGKMGDVAIAWVRDVADVGGKNGEMAVTREEQDRAVRIWVQRMGDFDYPVCRSGNSIVEVMLHQACHAWMLTYSCRCQAKCNGGGNNAPDGEHREEWKELARAIEEAAERLLDQEVNLGAD